MADAITTKNITLVDEVQSVDNTDKVFVNDNGSFKQISVSNLMKQAPSGVTEEIDPTVSEWAKQPTKPSYTADEVGALPVGTKIPTKTSDLTNDSGYLTQIPEEYVTETELGKKGYVIEDDIPEKLPSPGILTFTGAVNDTYDGSTNKTINIPTGGGGGTSDYNALTNKPTLNGVEISGDKTSADYKISAEITRVDHGTADTTFELPPNQYHTWGEVASLTLTLGAGTSGQANGYWFSFDSGDTATTLSLPETVKTDIVVEPNMHYECSIVGNYMTFEEWEVSA